MSPTTLVLLCSLCLAVRGVSWFAVKVLRTRHEMLRASMVLEGASEEQRAELVEALAESCLVSAPTVRRLRQRG